MSDLQPQKLEENENLGERLEQEIKNTLFEYTYLNEKTIKRNIKNKDVLYPTL